MVTKYWLYNLSTFINRYLCSHSSTKICHLSKAIRCNKILNIAAYHLQDLGDSLFTAEHHIGGRPVHVRARDAQWTCRRRRSARPSGAHPRPRRARPSRRRRYACGALAHRCRLHRRTEPRREPAGKQARAVQRRLGVDPRERDLGVTVYSAKVEVPVE